MAASVMTGAISLANSVTAPSNRGSLALPVFSLVKNLLNTVPAILLADEPTGALDQTSGKEVLKLFRELNDMGNTIVMITHDLGVAQSAKRIVRIVDGQLYE